MTTKFISIQALATAAKARGFDVRLSHDCSYAEFFAPDYKGERAVLWQGCTYTSAAAIIVSDRGGYGYGYNPFFYGPFHPGLCRSTCSNVQKVLSHPAMGDSHMEAA